MSDDGMPRQTARQVAAEEQQRFSARNERIAKQHAMLNAAMVRFAIETRSIIDLGSET